MVRGSGILRTFFPGAIWNKRDEQKTLYLTFDDGPTPDVTEFVLNELKRYHAKSSFFCIGKNVEEHPHIYHRIIEEGHTVGNHTYDHANGWSVDNKSYFKNIDKCSTIIDSELFRPPYGKITPVQAAHIRQKMGMKVVLWDLLSKDYSDKQSPQKCFDNVASVARAGDIIVFHDSLKAWPRLKLFLPQLLNYYSLKGFSFSRL